MSYVQRQVGAITENANRISILRDTDGDGVADQNSVFLEGLRQPFGMALIGDKLYVANTDSVVVFPYKTGDTRITDKGRKIMDLKVGHHWTRNLLPSNDGKKLYVTVGSGSNIGENGIEKEEGRAAILELDLETEKSRIYASGLRNPNGMALDRNGTLWTVVNERDELGDETPPDYLTSVKDGGFYGWPYSYWGKRVDTRVEPQRPDLVEKAIVPDYALGGHTAALGLALDSNSALPEPYRGGAFIGLHGSWNRSDLSGYKVVFVKFADGKPQGQPVDVLTGFLSDDKEKAYGRPVGVAFDSKGALLGGGRRRQPDLAGDRRQRERRHALILLPRPGTKAAKPRCRNATRPLLPPRLAESDRGGFFVQGPPHSKTRVGITSYSGLLRVCVECFRWFRGCPADASRGGLPYNACVADIAARFPRRDCAIMASARAPRSRPLSGG